MRLYADLMARFPGWNALPSKYGNAPIPCTWANQSGTPFFRRTRVVQSFWVSTTAANPNSIPNPTLPRA
jgi:hypothetical protein